MGEIGNFWKNVDNQLPAEAGLVQHCVALMAVEARSARLVSRINHLTV